MEMILILQHQPECQYVSSAIQWVISNKHTSHHHLACSCCKMPATSAGLSFPSISRQGSTAKEQMQSKHRCKNIACQPKLHGRFDHPCLKKFTRLSAMLGAMTRGKRPRVTLNESLLIASATNKNSHTTRFCPYIHSLPSQVFEY